MSHRAFLGILAISAFTAVLAPAAAAADVLFPGVETSVVLRMTPAHPAPGDRVRLSLESGAIDLSESEIEWRADGKRLAGGEGVVSAEVTAGALGSRMQVEASVVASDGAHARAVTDIIPTELDLLFSTDAYTPPFYQGRALPGAGGAVRLEAVPRFKRPGGALVPANQLTYTWRRDGRVLGSLSGKGRSSIEVPAPLPKSTNVYSVEARDSGGTLSGEAQAIVASAAPVLRLYEDSPLSGIRFGDAFAAQARVADSEVRIAAIPYFANVASPSDSLLSYEWVVNGKPVRSEEGAVGNEIALGGRQGGKDAARVTLTLSHAGNPFLDMQGGWTITLGQAPDSSFNPFLNL